MKRPLLIKIHLLISSFFFPFFILLPLSGALYTYGVKGEKVKQEVLNVATVIDVKSPSLESDVRELFKANDIQYNFKYIKKRPTYLELRPATKEHFYVYASDESTRLVKVTPNFIASIIEFHKGHGPMSVKQMQGLAGIGLILLSLTGFWLAVSLKPYRRQFLVSFWLGTLVLIALCL